MPLRLLAVILAVATSTVCAFGTAGCGGGDDDDGGDGSDGVVDVDQDGFSPPADCDDDDATVNPEAPELCDFVDNNCDEEVDEAADGPLATFFPASDGPAIDLTGQEELTATEAGLVVLCPGTHELSVSLPEGGGVAGRDPVDAPEQQAIMTGDIDGPDAASTLIEIDQLVLEGGTLRTGSGAAIGTSLIRGASGEHAIEIPDGSIVSITTTQLVDSQVSDVPILAGAGSTLLLGDVELVNNQGGNVGVLHSLGAVSADGCRITGNSGAPSVLLDGGATEMVLTNSDVLDNAGDVLAIVGATLMLDEVLFDGNSGGPTVVLGAGSTISASGVDWENNATTAAPACILVDGGTGSVASSIFHANSGGASGAVQVVAGDLSFSDDDFGVEESAEDNDDFDIVAGPSLLQVDTYSGTCSASGCVDGLGG